MRLSRLLCCLLATLALGCAWMVLAQAETAGVNGLFTNDQPSLSGSRDSLGSGSNGHSSGPGLKLVKTFQNGRKYVEQVGQARRAAAAGEFRADGSAVRRTDVGGDRQDVLRGHPSIRREQCNLPRHLIEGLQFVAVPELLRVWIKADGYLPWTKIDLGPLFR